MLLEIRERCFFGKTIIVNIDHTEMMNAIAIIRKIARFPCIQIPDRSQMRPAMVDSDKGPAPQ